MSIYDLICFVSLFYFIRSDPLYSSVSLLEWGKKNNVTISNIDIDNINKFMSISDIKKNDELMRIPSDLVITKDSLYLLAGKKLRNAWNELHKSNDTLFKTDNNKQQAYLSLIFDYTMRHRHGKIYSKYKTYFDYLEKTTKFHKYPMLLSYEELELIQNTIFGKDVISNIRYIEKEITFANNSLKLKPKEDFLKNRIITDTKIEIVNGLVSIVPLMELFNKQFTGHNAEMKYDELSKIVIIRATEDISKGKDIILASKRLSNTMMLIYHGETIEDNQLIGPTTLQIFHKKLQEDYPNIKFPSKYVDISKDEFSKIMYEEYTKTFPQMKLDDLIDLMIKSMQYYFDGYEKITAQEINKKILNPDNQINIKRVLDIERKIFQKRIDQLIHNKKPKKDISDL